MKRQAAKYQVVLGVNLRRIRTERGLLQDGLAGRMRTWPLDAGWTQATVAAVELGSRDVSLGEALLLQQALDVPLRELLAPLEDTPVIEVEGAQLPASVWSRLAEGQPSPGLNSVDPDLMKQFLSRPPVSRYGRSFGFGPSDTAKGFARAGGVAEQRLARKLSEPKYRLGKVGALDVAAAAQSLWGRSLAEERDSRFEHSGDSASDRMRAAQVTRQQLQGEIAAWIKGRRKKS
jgi:transcriptional regulator with XRE-family HTH domain